MSGTKEGSMKGAARRLGMSAEDYAAKIEAGLKWCGGCRDFHPSSVFGPDRNRPDGLRSRCPATLLYRRVPHAERDQKKENARHGVAKRVMRGVLPSANSLPCMDCGHVWSPGERRHEYDHARGYDGENRWYVEPVCTLCHAEREVRRKATP